MSVGTDEDVFGFEVAVDDTCCVEAFDAFYDLGGVETCAVAAESTPSSKLSSQIASWVEILEEATLNTPNKRARERENTP